MSNIQQRQTFFEESAKQLQARQLAGEQGRGADFYVSAFEGYAKDAAQKAALETAEDNGELLDLRFLGPRANNGTLPLHQFLDIINPINNGLNAAARRLRTGKESAKNNDAIRETLGLKMAGMASGSARVMVLGDSRSDLTSYNLFGTTVEQTFRLLTSHRDEFYDAVDAVGGIAARHFGDALQHTAKHGLAAEFSLKRNDLPGMNWHGSPPEINRVVTLIDTTKEPEVIEQSINGIVAALSENGRIVLRHGDNKERVRFPLRLIDEVQQLTLSQEATLNVRTARYWDAVMKIDVFKHTLVSIVKT